VTDLAPVLQGFFTDRLARQKKASPNTVAAYREHLPAPARLRLRPRAGKQPAQLSLADLDAALIGGFPQPPGRAAGQRQRHPANARLARDPTRCSGTPAPESTRARRRHQPGSWPSTPTTARSARSSANLTPRGDRRPRHRTRPARAGTADATGPCSCLAVQTGAASLRAHRPETGRTIHLGGRLPTVPAATARAGEKNRANPAHQPDRQGHADLARPSSISRVPGQWAPLFPTQPGGRLSRDAVERLRRQARCHCKHKACPRRSGTKHVTPHTLRHSARDGPPEERASTTSGHRPFGLGHEGTENHAKSTFTPT